MPRRKISEGLTALELGRTLTQLRTLLATLTGEGGADSEDTAVDQVRSMISTIEEHPFYLPFSKANAEILERFNIFKKGYLFLRPDAMLCEAIKAARTVSHKIWTNDLMCQHIGFLLNEEKIKNEATARMVIDTFFFRSTAMVPPSQKVIVALENNVPPVRPMESRTDTISGNIDYTAIVADPSDAEMYLENPGVTQGQGNRMISFFATEAKAAKSVSLEDHLPQVVLELVASAKSLGKNHIRGAITNGFEWYFVVVDLNPDGEGAKYLVSQGIQWICKVSDGERFVEETSDRYDPTLVAGILSSWIPASFEEFQDDQWFAVQLGPGLASG